MSLKERVIRLSGFLGWCSGSDRLVSVQVNTFGAEPRTKLLNGQVTAPVWSLVGKYLASWEVGQERQRAGVGGGRGWGDTPPVPAGLTPVASKDTGGLSPAYKGLGPEIEAQDSLGLRTYTPQIR